MDYLPKLIQAIIYRIMNTPESDIRNYSKKGLDEIQLALEELAKRCMSLGEKNEVRRIPLEAMSH